jgi:hypothetical protein
MFARASGFTQFAKYTGNAVVAVVHHDILALVRGSPIRAQPPSRAGPWYTVPCAVDSEIGDTVHTCVFLGTGRTKEARLALGTICACSDVPIRVARGAMAVASFAPARPLLARTIVRACHWLAVRAEKAVLALVAVIVGPESKGALASRSRITCSGSG